MAELSEGTTSGVAALERGLTILRAFGADSQALTLTDLAAATGYYKSTTLRLCASLMRFRFLQRLDDGRFRLGPAVFELGRVYQQSFELSAFVRPTLRRVVDRTGETASFYVRDGDADVCLYRVQSPHPVRDVGIAEGGRFPIDQSACSRVLSAFSEGAADPERDRIRRAVVAVARQSARVPGTSAIVCPVFSVGQRLVGALLLSGPQSRFTRKAVADMTAALVDEGARLTLAVGGDPAVYAAAESRRESSSS